MSDQHDPAREVWRPVGVKRYEVSSHGRVRNGRTGHVLRPWANPRGYLYVDLGRRPQRLTRSVHSLVLDAFVGPAPAGHDVDHVDWQRTHNCVRNLRWLRYEHNHVRWNGRGPGGRIVWATPDTPPEDLYDYEPCSGAPLTAEQEQQLLDHLQAAGWTEGLAS